MVPATSLTDPTEVEPSPQVMLATKSLATLAPFGSVNCATVPLTVLGLATSGPSGSGVSPSASATLKEVATAG